MGQAKRRKQALGSAYGIPEGSNGQNKKAAPRQSANRFKLFTESQVASMLSKKDSLQLMNLCQFPGPWEIRCVPEAIDEIKEIIFTCEHDMVCTTLVPVSYQESNAEKGPVVYMDSYTIKKLLGD